MTAEVGMKPYVRFLRYMLRHRWYMLLECLKVGLVWRGLVHDLSKFRPSEFFAYAQHYFGEGDDPFGETFPPCWLLHLRRNDHHWQWWVNVTLDGRAEVFPMSPAARQEMLCDWKAAGRAKGHPCTRRWYAENRDRMLLHPETRKWIEGELGLE